MPIKITLDMPMFGDIRNNLNQVMIDTINKSPILVQQLTQYNDAVIAGSAGIGFLQNIE